MPALNVVEDSFGWNCNGLWVYHNSMVIVMITVIILQDELHKHAASETETTEKCLKENFEEYIHSYGLFSINNLMAIAKLRYHLSQLAIALCKLPQNGAVETSPKDWKDTLEYVQAIFHEPKGKYPAEYVVKFIIRQYGIERFNELKTSYPWIVPEHLKSKEENSVSVFVDIAKCFSRHNNICDQICQKFDILRNSISYSTVQ